MSPVKEFYDKYAPAAVAATAGTGLFPAVALTQAALESNNGRSALTRLANNFHGVKAFRGEPFVTMRTREESNGRSIFVNAKFIKYATAVDAFKGWVKFLQNNPRYKRAGVFTALSPESQLRCIAKAGYATDSGYFDKVKVLLHQILTYAPVSGVFAIPIIGAIAASVLNLFNNGLSHIL